MLSEKATRTVRSCIFLVFQSTLQQGNLRGGFCVSQKITEFEWLPKKKPSLVLLNKYCLLSTCGSRVVKPTPIFRTMP